MPAPPKPLAFANELLEWYWQFGVRRSDTYEIPKDNWLRRLYERRNLAARIADSLGNTRPAMAVWGHSQTGKSTAISNYVDEGADLAQLADPAKAGENTALHWEGGTPAFFVVPNAGKEYPHMISRVLNPYNGGKDGSACLGRFVAGSLTPQPGRHHVRDAAFPIELEFVTPVELWHAFARGYASECEGPERDGGARRQTVWTLPELKQRLSRHRKSSPTTGSTKAPPSVDRRAVECLIDFCEIVEQLAAAKLPNFEQLTESPKDWAEFRASLLEKADHRPLLASFDAAEAFACDVLFDGFATLRTYYREMRAFWEKLAGPKGEWTGKTVLCSIEAATALLNMDAAHYAFLGPDANPQSPRSLVCELTANLRYSVDGELVRIGLDPKLPKRLAPRANDFAILQGLVWELRIPLNLDHLQPSPFREFIDGCDLLDFPGVANTTTGRANRILPDEEDPELPDDPDAVDTSKPRECSVKINRVLFFKEVLKRGKTASIVATYAQRLNIDGFAILQAVDSIEKCTNPEQLIYGIQQWWRAMSYDPREGLPAGGELPLALVLTFWATQLNAAKSSQDTQIYSRVIHEIVRRLNEIGDPAIATTFAVNNHHNPHRARAVIEDRRQRYEPGKGAFYQTLTTYDQNFQRQFSKPISRESFDAMLTDEATGGADFFFAWAGKTFKGREGTRRASLEARLEAIGEALVSLLQEQEIFPRPQERDWRRPRLKQAREALKAAAEAASPTRLIELNFAVRLILNVDARQLSPLPELPDGASEPFLTAFLQGQLERWINEQSRTGGNLLTAGGPDLTTLGLDDPNELRAFLRALVISAVGKDAVLLQGIARWLKGLYDLEDDRLEFDPRREFLAVKLSNLLTTGLEPGGPRDEFSFGLPQPETTESPYASLVIQPILRRLEQLERATADEDRQRDELPGDVELRQLCAERGIDPLAPAEPETAETP